MSEELVISNKEKYWNMSIVELEKELWEIDQEYMNSAPLCESAVKRRRKEVSEKVQEIKDTIKYKKILKDHGYTGFAF